MRRWVTFLSMLAVARACVAADMETLSSQPFESIEGLRVNETHAQARLALSADVVKSGAAALRIDYDLPEKRSGIHVSWPVRIGRVPTVISLWVFGDGSRNVHGVRLVDSTGETHYFKFGLLHGSEWRLCTIDVNTWGKRAHCWGGDGNKEIDLPVVAVAYDVRSYSAYGPCTPKGSAVIDDLLIRGEAESPTTHSQPGLHSVTAVTGVVGRFERFELRCALQAEADNPYDTKQVEVRARFVAPSGKAKTVDGFFVKPYRPVLGRKEQLVDDGESHWRVRFAPTEVGEHTFTVTLRDRKRTYLPKAGRFECVRSERRGFLRVSPDDGNYFVHDTGDAFIGIGLAGQMWGGDRHNCLQRYKSILSDLAAFGGNYTSVNVETLGGGVFGLDGRAPLGANYDQENAARLDYMVQMAERRGIAIVVNLFQTSLYSAKHWANSRFNSARGGPCQSAVEFFTHPEAKGLQKQLLRYIVARWGHSPSVAVWELCNEVNYSQAFRTDPAIVRDWHREMAAYLHEIDPNRHLVSTSFGSSDLCEDPDLWRMPEIDSTIIHIYTNEPVQGLWRRVGTKRQYGKPCIGGECGIPFPTVNKAYERDPEGLHFHNAAWTSIMSGAAANVLPWWGDRYWNTLDLVHLLEPLSRFCQGIDWPHEQFERVQLNAQRAGGEDIELADVVHETSISMDPPALTELRFAGRELFSFREKQHIDDDPKVLLQRMSMGLLFGSDDAKKRSQMKLVFDSQVNTKAQLVLGAVAKAGTTLRIAGPRSRQTIKVADQDGKDDPKARELAHSVLLDLPKGKSEWTVESAGRGWVTISRIEIERFARPADLEQLMVIGLSGKRMSLVWFYDRHSSWYQRSIGKPLRSFDGVCAYLPAKSGARYRIEWWDTWRGHVVEESQLTAQDGNLRLAPPRFERDVVCKVRKMAN